MYFSQTKTSSQFFYHLLVKLYTSLLQWQNLPWKVIAENTRGFIVSETLKCFIELLVDLWKEVASMWWCQSSVSDKYMVCCRAGKRKGRLSTQCDEVCFVWSYIYSYSYSYICFFIRQNTDTSWCLFNKWELFCFWQFTECVNSRNSYQVVICICNWRSCSSALIFRCHSVLSFKY